MANLHYASTRIRFDMHPESLSRTNVDSSLSYLSDSTFGETEFENLHDVQSDRYGDYTQLSKDVSSIQDETLYCNEAFHVQNGEQNVNSSTHHSVLYENKNMLQKARESVTPPLPRRKNRGQKIVQRISTIPTSVRLEIKGWSALKMASLTILGIVLGAGLVIGVSFAYKFFVSNNSTNNKIQSPNDLTEGSSCSVLESLKCDYRLGKDKKKTFEKNKAKCEKIHKKTINGYTYIIYEDKVSFIDAMDFCHRIARIKMLFPNVGECKSFQNQSFFGNKATTFWIAQWCLDKKISEENDNISCWQEVSHTGDILVTNPKVCSYIPSNIGGHDENCGRNSSGCLEKRYPVCKCERLR